jgi:hypothetical protein
MAVGRGPGPQRIFIAQPLSKRRRPPVGLPTKVMEGMTGIPPPLSRKRDTFQLDAEPRSVDIPSKVAESQGPAP